LGTKVALNVINSKDNISNVTMINDNSEELVKDKSKLPKPIGIKDTILNCSKGEKANIVLGFFLTLAPI